MVWITWLWYETWWKRHHFWFWLNHFETECCYIWFFVLWTFPQDLILQKVKGTDEWLMFDNKDRYETQTPVGGDSETRGCVSCAAQCELMKTFLSVLLQSVWKGWHGNLPPPRQLSSVLVFIRLIGVFLCLHFEQSSSFWEDEDEEEDTALQVDGASVMTSLGFLLLRCVDEDLLWHTVKSLHQLEGASSCVLFSSANKWSSLLQPVCLYWIQSSVNLQRETCPTRVSKYTLAWKKWDRRMFTESETDVSKAEYCCCFLPLQFFVMLKPHNVPHWQSHLDTRPHRPRTTVLVLNVPKLNHFWKHDSSDQTDSDRNDTERHQNTTRLQVWGQVSSHLVTRRLYDVHL